jgi:biopolymer transport protein ExbD
MGMNLGGGKGSVKSEINITPLVDIVLVLLIIFFVTLPMLLRQVTLEVPRKIQDNEFVPPDQAKQLSILVKNDLSVVFNDGDKESPMPATELYKTLQPILEAKKTEKIVFVDFEEAVPWSEVIGTMDTIRRLSSNTATGPSDSPRWDEIKVALKLREPGAAAAPK